MKSILENFIIISYPCMDQVSAEIASEYGELVADAETGELLHYAEKPETFVSIK
jgi:hypothetical protein